MDKLLSTKESARNTSSPTKCKELELNKNKHNDVGVLNWMNSSNFEDDNNSILSDSTDFSSSVVESEDYDYKLSTLSLDNDVTDTQRNSLTSNSSSVDKIEILQQIFNRNNNIQTVGNVNIENSSQVHIGNITYITGPIHITNPDEHYISTLLKENTTIHTNSHPPRRQTRASLQKEKIEVAEREESNRPEAFLGNIKRKVAENVLHIVDRRRWLAQKPMDPYEYISTPVEIVVILHSATEMATTQADNIYLIRNIQCFHIESCRWNDISYNFLIGNDGNVYEGRGWGVVGAHTLGYNTISVGICFVGCFMRELPTPASLSACKKIIQRGVDEGYIAPTYKIVGHCQCSSTESPGRKLYEEIQTWDHYSADL